MTEISEGRSVLARFLDGPLAGKGDILLPEDVYGWPLPERMRVLTHEGVENAALWDADGDGDGLPDAIINSPNAVTYGKVSESQIPDEAMDRATHLIRGAAYSLEVASHG